MPSYRVLPPLRRKSPWLSIGLFALLLTAAALAATNSSTHAADEHQPHSAPAHSLKVIGIESGRPKLIGGDGENQHALEFAPDCEIRLNGEPATLDEISPADAVAVELDAQGHIVRADVTHTHSGIFLALRDSVLELTTDYTDRQRIPLAATAQITLNGSPCELKDLRRGDQLIILPNRNGEARTIDVERQNLFLKFWDNFRHNLFKPLLLFFYLGFSVPLLKVAFEFPHVIYQGLTIYLLVSIGWKGGEELAELSGAVLGQALMFMLVGFCTNFVLGLLAYGILRRFIPTLRRVDAATVAAYYGSDSAGTFVTCVGVLTAASISYAAYMPVMLAIMEIPGCLVGLFLVSRLRGSGMDPLGNMPDEPGYTLNPVARPALVSQESGADSEVVASVEGTVSPPEEHSGGGKPRKLFSAHLLREVFLNPGLFLLFGGILIGFVSRLQGHKVTDADDSVFVNLFQGMLCLFLLEMGMTASKRLKDLKTAGWRFILFGLLAPNIFAISGICVVHAFSLITRTPIQLGTYALFAVLCGAASYIAVPAIQRLAIPEASPTLPLAASLGLTFSYNVTVGIPVYILVAQSIMMALPLNGN